MYVSHNALQMHQVMRCSPRRLLPPVSDPMNAVPLRGSVAAYCNRPGSLACAPSLRATSSQVPRCLPQRRHRCRSLPAPRRRSRRGLAPPTLFNSKMLLTRRHQRLRQFQPGLHSEGLHGADFGPQNWNRNLPPPLATAPQRFPFSGTPRGSSFGDLWVASPAGFRAVQGTTFPAQVSSQP